MRSSTTTIHDMTIPYVNDGITTYWPIRSVSEVIGISWHSQVAKLQPPRYKPRELDVQLPGKHDVEMLLCLQQAEFEFWLKTLNPRKISPAARLRLALLRQHFFQEAPAEQRLPVPMAKAGLIAPLVLSRMVQWKLYQVAPSARPGMLKEIADQFHEENGYAIIGTQEPQLRTAVTSLSSIIAQLGSPLKPSELSVSQRVDTIIESLVEVRGRCSPINDAELAALMCGVELERLQRKEIRAQPLQACANSA